MKNHLHWCMDSCRWDVFEEANAPNMKARTEFRKVYSRAGFTPPSLFSTFMNCSWYNSGNDRPIPSLPVWGWIPRDLQEKGYHTVFISSNPLMKHYEQRFTGFNEFIYIDDCRYHAHEIVEKVKRIYDTVEQPKYIFLLLMETHQPYFYLKQHTQEYVTANYRPITRQVKAVESIDADFGVMMKTIDGTDTDVLIFSDHGDLDLKLDGAQGHGEHMFHIKLFEIPLGRFTA